MTTLSRSFRHSDPARVIDVRCSAKLAARPIQEGRCQLFAGHDGPHAVMFGRAGGRLVRTWRTGDSVPVDTAALQRPWTFGFPLPAWFEVAAAPKLSG